MTLSKSTHQNTFYASKVLKHLELVRNLLLDRHLWCSQAYHTFVEVLQFQAHPKKWVGVFDWPSG